MTPRLLLASALALLPVGCGKHSETSPSSPPSAQPAQDNPSADAPAAQRPRVADGTESDPGAASAGSAASTVARAGATDSESAAALGELTQALRKYSFEHHRLPKAFSEVVAAGYVKNMPQPPPGRKFEIDPKTIQVVLVKQ